MTLLVVDDEGNLRESLSDALKEAGVFRTPVFRPKYEHSSVIT